MSHRFDRSPSSASAHEHDRGLAHDLAAMERLALGRRHALGLLGLGTGALLTGCGSGSNSMATPTPAGACTTYAAETAGPFPADGTNTSSGVTSNVLTQSGVVRSDIRSSFVGSTATTPGVPLTLVIDLANSNANCAPLANYAVYIWHCSRAAQYSLYDVPAESWLRGVQVSNAAGQVRFTTIYPGCYAGRFPHIHFEVYSSMVNATNGRFAVLVSQFALPDPTNRIVYASSGYQTSLANYRNVSLGSDNVFADNSAAQLSAMTPTVAGTVTAGLTAAATVGIAT